MSTQPIQPFGNHFMTTQDQREGTRRQVMAALLEAPMRAGDIIPVLDADLRATYVTVSACLHFEANASTVIHLDDGRWALWGSDAGVEQRIMRHLRHRVSRGGELQLAMPTCTATLARSLDLPPELVTRCLCHLYDQCRVYCDGLRKPSWWVGTDGVDVKITARMVKITLRGQGKSAGVTRWREYMRRGDLLVNGENCFATLESAALELL